MNPTIAAIIGFGICPAAILLIAICGVARRADDLEDRQERDVLADREARDAYRHALQQNEFVDCFGVPTPPTEAEIAGVGSEVEQFLADRDFDRALGEDRR
jgi:hypothetical protein